MFVGFLVVGVLSHEAGHLTANNLLGGTGKIFYDYTWTSGHMEWATLPEENIWLVYLGGGVLAAIFMFVFFWLPPRLTPGKQDVYVEAAVAAHILDNLFYAPTELILYFWGQKLFEWAWLATYVLGAILFVALYIKTIIKWTNRPYKNNGKG